MEKIIDLPFIAKKIAEWFPELDGRAIAIMDDDISEDAKEITLPLAMVSMNGVTPLQPVDIRQHDNLTLIEDISVEFWFKPERYPTKSGGKSPFWSYRDYLGVLSVLLHRFNDDPDFECFAIEFVSLNNGATEAAVMFELRFRLSRVWNLGDNYDKNDGKPITLTVDFGC